MEQLSLMIRQQFLKVENFNNINMRKFFIFLLSLILTANISFAETKEEKEARKTAEKIQKQKEDSIDNHYAIKALKANRFAVMADQLQYRTASSFVDDNLNFIAADKERAMVQVVPFCAGFNGLNIKGNITKYDFEETKKGDIYVNINVFGSTLNARISLTLFKGSNDARIIITPNFRSGDITMYGKVFPLEIFDELERELKR